MNKGVDTVRRELYFKEIKEGRNAFLIIQKRNFVIKKDGFKNIKKNKQGGKEKMKKAKKELKQKI